MPRLSRWRKTTAIRNLIALWSDRLRFSVRVQRLHGRLLLVVHERHRRAVRLIKYGVTFVGLAVAFVVFSSVWAAFAVALTLALLGHLTEYVFFSYRDLFVHPLPEFEICPEKWLGMGFGYASHPHGALEVPVVAMIVSDPTYARQLQDLFKLWCYGQTNDSARCISASVILQGPEEYYFLVYPSPERAGAKEFFRQAARRHRNEPALQDRLSVQLVLAKGFRILGNSYLPTFRRRYQDGVPVIFQVSVLLKAEASMKVGENFFILHSLKIRDRADLTRRDFEYSFLRVRV